MIEQASGPREFQCLDCKRHVVVWGDFDHEDELCVTCAWIRARLKDGTMRKKEEDGARRRLGVEKR